MKRSILILVLLAVIATGVFAKEFSLSAGGGVLFDWSIDNGITYDSNSYFLSEDVMAFGGFAFFDATYAELEVNFTYGLRSLRSNDSRNETGANGNYMALGFSLLGKYPINLTKVTVSPLLGGSYNLVLVDKFEDGGSISDSDYYKSMDWSQFGALAGVGVDITLTESLFLKTEALFHFRFPNKIWSDFADSSDGKTSFGMGPKVKVGVGYKFFSKEAAAVEKQ